MAVLSAIGIVGGHRKYSQRGNQANSAFNHVPGNERSSQILQIPERLLYPYSVIPGGIEDAQELRNAIARDPLVAALYANFDLSRAHIIRLKHNEEVYVAYRLGGRIYWTKKRLLLRAGETLITDGKHEARTRCGNRISTTPVQPVSESEPADAALNATPDYNLLADDPGTPPTLPADPPVLGPTDPTGPPPAVPPSSPPVWVIPPPYFPIVGGGPPILSPPPPPVATPEPGTLSLLGIGIAALCAAEWFVRGRKKREA